MIDIIDVEISELGKTITGKTPSSKNPEDFGEEFMFVTPSDNWETKKIGRTERYVSEIGINKLLKKALPPNSVMVSCIGSAMGKVLMNKSKCLTNQQINSIVVNEKKFNADYIYYVLINNYKLLRAAGTGSTSLPLLNKTDFDALKLKVHKDRKIQKQIAKVLSDLDAKIEVNNKINQELEAMAKTLYDYWFVQFDFPTSARYAATVGKPDIEGKPYKSSGGKMVFNEELKREIPEGWKVESIGNIVDCNKWNRTKENNFTYLNYLDTSNLTRNVIDSIQTLNFETDKIPSRAQRVIAKNDILYSTVRPNQQHFGLIKLPKGNLVASTGFAQIRSNDPRFSNDFIYQFLCQDYVADRLQQIAEGSVSAYPSISHNDIMNLKIVLPKDDMQLEKADSIFQRGNEKIALNLEENQKLAELRDWLLPMLMNGQVSVSEGYGPVERELGMVAEESKEYK